MGKIKHGQRHTRLYKIWCCMKERCYGKHSSRYQYYGARGITVCDEWINDFKAFYDWAYANGYQDNLTIDRINNDGNYEPNNCRWATYKEQARNMSINHLLTYNGETHCMADWADILNISYACLRSRIRRNWSIEKAFTTPVNREPV